MFCRAARLCAAATIPLAVAACGGGGGAPATTVAVTATDTECTIDKPSVPAGTVRFAVHNRGSVITEVYLLGERDRVVDEIENVEPGDTAEFTVEPGGGQYTVNCKPGQLGEGIRTALEVTGEPSAEQLAEPDDATARGVRGFAVALDLRDDGFAEQFADLAVVSGQVVTFELTNNGTVPHAFAVLAPDGTTALAQSEPIAPGATATLPVTFTQTGTHTAVDPQLTELRANFEVIE